MKKETIKRMLSNYDLVPDDIVIDKFVDYYELLIETNKVINLTAITEFNEVVEKHFSDSISIIKSFPELREKLQSGKEIIDIGTGAGFPGIPLKIIFPELMITLMDSLGKRIIFLENVFKKLCLNNINAVNMRAEEAGKNILYREQFDYCVCRAVAKMNIISEYALPLVKLNGYFIPYKSGDIKKECTEAERAIKLLGGKIEKISNIVLPETDISRSHIIIRKVIKTDKLYPRANSKISKQPL